MEDRKENWKRQNENIQRHNSMKCFQKEVKKKKLKIHVKQQNFLPKVKFETQRKKGRKLKQKQVKKDNDTERSKLMKKKKSSHMFQKCNSKV